MTPEERAEVAPAADNFKDLFGARDKKPLGVKVAETAIGFTPVGSAVEIAEELDKDDPSYGKVALIAAGDVLGAAIPAAGPVAKTLIKEGVQKLDDVVDVKQLTKDAETDAIDNLGLTEESLEAWKTENYAKDKYRIAPIEKLEEAAKALREGEITSSEFRELSDAYQPIIPIDEMPNFPTKEEVVQALHATDKRKVAKGIIGVNKEIPDGTPISARLDIPAYNDTDTWIVSLHDGTEKSGKTVGYAQTAVLDNVTFTTNPLAASSIASGKGKTTIARMQGSYVNADPEEIYNVTKELLEKGAEGWSQIGMNPYRASYFYDKADGMPVISADEVIQVGPLVMAKNVKKTTPDDEMFEFTNKVTGVTANFNEGGMAIEDQMEMNFGTRGVDPVSGNEVPVGSLPEEVRDDIPAQLSEGEYVVPADVVRYYGVKFFEDLRTEAKLGFDAMDAAGRIGGEPVAMNVDDEGLGLDLSDLEVVEVQAMSEGGDAKGAYTFDNIKKKLVRKQAEDKPVFRNRAEEIIYNIRNMFGDRDDKPKKATDKPPIDFGFGGNPMERAERKYGSPSSPTKNESYRPSSATQREVYKPKPNQPSIAEQIGFDEGGDTGPRVIDEGTTGQLLPDDFDPVLDSVGGGVMEMREYRNAAGHTLMIPFLDGIPQTVIPDGYFPVGSTPVVTPVNTAASSGSRNNDSDDKEDITEPFNYKELTIDELTEEVKNLQETPNFLGTGILSGIFSVAQKRHRNKIIEEIDRRLSNESFNNPNAEVFGAERSYLENLKEVAEAPPEKGMVGKLIDKITGEETEQPNLPNLEDPTYSELPSIKEVGEAQVEEAYTPEAKTDTNPFKGSTYDEVPSSSRIKSEAEKIEQSYDSIPPSRSGFGGMGRDPAEEFGGSQTRFQQTKQTKKVSTPKPTPVNEMSDRVKRARQNTQKVLKDMRDRGASREERTAAMAAGARTEQVLKDLDRGIVRGFEKGGSVDKPAVKKVVKGLKKASKSHAKQAEQLEKAMKAKNKKSK